MSKNLVVRFAGEGGQGVVGGAELMASAAASGGYHVLTFSTFPSQIKGGPAWGQARISSEPILTPISGGVLAAGFGIPPERLGST